MNPYSFTNDWFGPNVPVWDILVRKFNPRRILEIGSFEGRSACWFIDSFGPSREIELHCVDTWEGGIEHADISMTAVEKRFNYNTGLAISTAAHKVTLVKHKRLSGEALARLLVTFPAGAFDVIYIDGSHQAPDVLTDAVMAFPLLRVGGGMIFDDYIWSNEEAGQQDPLRMPKPAIDAFMNIFARKMVPMRGVPLYQLFALKTGV